MLRLGRFVALMCVMAVLLACAVMAQAQAAPIPEQILNGKTAFVANGGSASSHVSSAELYAGVYAALRSWGKYVLVGTPSEADLIIVASFSAPPSDADNGTSFLKPQLRLSVQDPKTGVPLWTVTEYSWPNVKKGGGDKAFESAVGQLRIIAEAKHTDKPQAATQAPAAKKEAPKPAAAAAPEAAKPAKKEAAQPENTLRKNW